MVRQRWMVVVAVAASAVAHASFDMVLALDYGSKSIKRFDGQTGAYFGEFGKGRLKNPRFIEQGPNAGEIVVTDVMDSTNAYSTIYVYNWHSGELLRQYFDGQFFTLSGIARTSVPGEYWVADSFASSGTYKLHRVRLTPNAILATQTFTGNMAGFGGDLMVRGSSVVLGGFAGQLQTVTGNSATTANLSNASTRAVVAGTVRNIAGSSQVFGAQDGSLYNPTGSVFAGPLMSGGIYGIGNGHEYDYLAGYEGTVAKINIYNRGFLIGSMGEGILQSPSDVLVMTAPEPGVLIGLGVGVAALLRRRRPKQPSA